MPTLISVPEAVSHAVSTYCPTTTAQPVCPKFPAITGLIPIHVPPDILALIERAAVSAQQAVPEFIVEAAMFAAEDELLYKASQNLTAEQLAACHDILDRPWSENAAYQRFLARRAPWET